MSLTLHLGNVTVTDGEFDEGSEVVISGKSYTVGAGGSDSLELGDNGILELADGAITFEAGKDFSGTLTLGTPVDGEETPVKAVDFAKASGAVTFDAKDGAVVSITGSDYNDKLTSKVDGASIDGGDGDDTITFSGDGKATIEGGNGDDTYVISGKGAEVIINDTTGSDNVKISGASVEASVSLGGSDDNIVLVDSSASEATVAVTTGSGDDIITSKAGKNLTINSGAGDDVITIAGKESIVEIDAGDGDDVIDIAKGADKSKVAISTGAGDDTVKINAASVTGSVNGGDGNDDVLVIAGANASLTVDNVETVNLTGKNGKVSVTGGTVNSSAVGATIKADNVNVTGGTVFLDSNGGSGIELTISSGSVTADGAVNATVTGGTFVSDISGTDDIVVNGYGASVNTGNGEDKITVSADATGTNTLTLGADADVVSVEAGNSKVVITDLGDEDVLTLVDASDETTATLSKTGVLTVVDEGQFNVTANVYTGDYNKDEEDYTTAVKNQAKNNVYHASVNAGEAGVIDLYTAAGTTKNVTVNASTANKNIIDLTAAKSSEVTVDGSKVNTIALGNGKDEVTVSNSTNGKTEITGYNFANKDAITAGGAFVALHTDGRLTIDVNDEDDETGVFVTTTANNNVYAAKVDNNDYYTAKKGAGAVKITTDKDTDFSVVNAASASSSTINITNGNGTVKIGNLSEGADVINVAAGATVTATAFVDDEKDAAVYDYADGDVINLGKATIDNVTLTEDDDNEIAELVIAGGKDDAETHITLNAAALENGLYAAKVVSNNNKDTNTYATAVTDAEVKIDLSASSFGKVSFDGTNAAEVDVAISAGALAALSNGNDVITVNGLTKNTNEHVAIYNFSAEDDKLVLSNIKLADLYIAEAPTNGLNITYDNKKSDVYVELTKDIENHRVDLNINGTDVKAAVSIDAALTLDDDSKDAYFLGLFDTTLNVADDIENTVINLSDTNKYKAIHAVSVDKDATGISIIGTDDKEWGEAVNASANENGVQVSLGAGTDSVTLSAGADVVWFDAKQGKNNEITSFTYGTGENADILYLSDVAKADNEFVADGSGTVTLKDSAASANITFADDVDTNTSEIMQVMLKDGKIYNVAMDIKGDDGIYLNLDEEIKVDEYIGKKISVVLKSDDEVAYTYNNNAKVDSIDGTNTNGAMTIVGVKNVTLGTSEEENANKVWAKGNATINATTAAGNDQVWFQSGVDKKVFVTGFADYSEDNDANDNIKLVGTKSVADIVSQYKLASKEGNVVITGASSAASKLTVENTSTVVLTDDNGVSYVAKVGEKGDSADFSADVQIYAGMTELSSSNIEDDTVILLDGGSSTTFDLKSDYYIGSSVTKFDAAGSEGNLVIVGSKTAKNELIGGAGNDLIYGGGASNDTMKGGEGSNTFFYGANDGKDVVENITDEDTINLYSGNLVDLGYNEDKDAYIFTFEGGNTLTVNGDLAEGTKVQYAGATFVYQKDEHSFIEA